MLLLLTTDMAKVKFEYKDGLKWKKVLIPSLFQQKLKEQKAECLCFECKSSVQNMENRNATFLRAQMNYLHHQQLYQSTLKSVEPDTTDCKFMAKIW